MAAPPPADQAGDLIDADTLILQAIAPLCANGVPEELLPYFHEKVSPLVSEIVVYLLEMKADKPEFTLMLWMMDMLGVPEEYAAPVRAWLTREAAAKEDTDDLRSILKYVAPSDDRGMPERTKRGSRAFVTPAGNVLSEERLRQVAPLTDDQKKQFIQVQPMFQGLEAREMKAVVKAFALTKYLDGEEVQKQGMKPDGMHIVVRGEGKALVSQEVGHMKVGDIFGDQEMLQGLPANKTVEASAGPMTTLTISSLALKALGLKKKIGNMSRKKAMKIRDPTRQEADSGRRHHNVVTNKDDKQLIIDAVTNNGNIKEVLHLTEEQIESLSKEAYREDFQAGAAVFNRGDYGDHFYIVNDGVFQLTDPTIVSEITASGKPLKLRAGDSFGELCLIYNAPRQATVSCLRTGSLWVLTRGTFKASVQQKLHGRLKEYADLISSVDVFNMFRDADDPDGEECMSIVCNALEEKYFIQDEVIVEQGAAADCFYIIFQGTCVVEKDGQDAANLGRGNSFGERALLEADTRAATVRVSSENCTVLAMDRIAFGLLLRPAGGSGRESVKTLKDASNVQIAQSLKSHLDLSSEVEVLKKIKMSELRRVGVLGRGAFGLVTMERHMATGELLALKAMSKGHIVESKLKNMVANEKACMEVLNNYFVVRLFRTFADASNIYFLIEPCFGGELFDLYTDRGDELWGSEPHSMFYAACVAMGLDHMHSRRVIYRDLKLENCLLTLSGYLKLTDLGISKVCVGKTYTVCGTTDYFAPETLRQSGHNRGVDWWALGVLLHIMMTGRSPFEAPDAMKTYRKIMKGFAKVSFPEDCPEHTVSLIRALCQKNPEERLTMGSLGIKNYKDHTWYRKFSWKDLEALSMAAPWVPTVTEEDIIIKTSRKQVEALPDIPFEDDGTGWDTMFNDVDEN